MAHAAQAAAPGPPNQLRAGAAARQVQKIDAEQPRPFDTEAFKKLLSDRLAQDAPNNPEQARDFKKSGKLAAQKQELTAAVGRERAEAEGDIRSQAAAPPDEHGIEPKQAVPLTRPEQAPTPGDLGVVGGVPKPRTDAEVAAPIAAETQQLDTRMAEADVTDDQLQRSNEPKFLSALNDKSSAKRNAAETSQAYRAQETSVLARMRGQAVAATSAQTASMHNSRGDLFSQVTTEQAATMTADQATRGQVGSELEAIYEETKAGVQARLHKLNDDVLTTFDRGVDAARKRFEDYVEQKLDERYEDLSVWLEDKLLTWGLPPEVEAIYRQGRDQYLASMDGVIDEVAQLVADGLDEAKSLVAGGRSQVAKKVASLGPALQDVGKGAAEAIEGKFLTLDQTIADKQARLVDGLAERYRSAVQSLDERLGQLRTENRSFLGKALSSVGEVISSIAEMKSLLTSVLAKAASVVTLIVRRPIDFLKNLVSAGAQGLKNFVANIGTHIKKGLMAWLFGALAGAGIQLPARFDLRGVFGLVMEVLGLTWRGIRLIAVDIVGERIVRALEQFADPIIVLVRDGPVGLWEWIKEKLGDLKAMLLDAIEGWVITNVIKAGITWIVGLLNPVSAFIKACKAIYDIVIFFTERAKQVAELVRAVVESVTAIALGSLGNAAKLVEDALAKSVPVAIGFLASLLGLSGLSETIKGFIEKLRAPVKAAVKWLISKAVALVKAAGKLLGIGKKDEAQARETGDPKRDAALNVGLAALEAAEAPYRQSGGISREQASQVAKGVKLRHPVFKQLDVVDGGHTWDFEWAASPGAKTKGPTKAGPPGSSDHRWTSDKELAIHFRDHKSEFPGVRAQEEYAKRAQDFFVRAQQARLPTKVDTDGTIRIYDRASNTFGSYTARGLTITFFRPYTGIRHWNSQRGETRRGPPMLEEEE